MVSRANAIRLNSNSDGVEDLEFNKNGNWVSLTGLVSSQNAPGMTANIATRNNLVSPLNSATNFGNAWTGVQNNPASNCRNGPKVVKGPNGSYSTLLTARTWSGARHDVVAYTCNYDTDVTPTAICANGVYQAVSLSSATSQSFTCNNPEANDFDFAQGQWVVSTQCGPNLCSVDFTTCNPLPGAAWYCESSNDPTTVTLLTTAGGATQVNGAAASTNVGLPFTFSLNGVNANQLWIYPQGLVALGAPGAADPGYVTNGNPYTTIPTVSTYVPVFNVATSMVTGGIFYSIVGNTITIQWQSLQTTGASTTAFYSAQLVLTGGAPGPSITYLYNGDPGAGVTFDTFGSLGTPYGCAMGLQADINAVLPYGTTGFALVGLDAVGRFRLLTNDATNGFVPYYNLVNSNGVEPGAPPLITIGTSSEVLGPLRFQRCCSLGTRVAVAQNSVGALPAAVVVYAGVYNYRGFSPNVEIFARFLAPNAAMTNWAPSAASGGAALTNQYSGVIGDLTINYPPTLETNIDLRGLAVTYVTPPGQNAIPVPFVVLSKQAPTCRVTGAIVDPPTTTGALFEYYALVCRDALCGSGGGAGSVADIRILADSTQLASGNLAEVFVNPAPNLSAGGNYSPKPEPDLLSLSISPKTGMPLILVGSTAGLPVLIECLDYQCNGAQLTVADDYLAGHFGEGFVVPGNTQLTVVSQAAWGIATESKPYAQRWTSYTTAPDGLTQCTESNAGKSFNIVGRVYLCTRLPRSPFSPSTFPPTQSSVRPVSTALFSWAEIGGRLRLYASENSA